MFTPVRLSNTVDCSLNTDVTRLEHAVFFVRMLPTNSGTAAGNRSNSMAGMAAQPSKLWPSIRFVGLQVQACVCLTPRPGLLSANLG